MEIREATEDDWDQIWPFFQRIILEGETYACPEDLTLESAQVDPASAGKGVGRTLGEYILEWARDAGFRSMQFNAVVETNTAAVHLWRSLGTGVR